MQDRFDPYQHWLGIPPAQQPPHHYRVLGIAPLEANPDVIRRAADQQAAVVRRHQSSQYLAVTNKLLADIAAAAACLLNPQTKAAYDAALRQQLGAVAPPQPWQSAAPAANMAPAPPPHAPTAPPVAGPPPGGRAGPPPAPAAVPVAPPMAVAAAAPPAGMPPAVLVSPPRERSSIPWPAVGLLLVAVAALVGVLWMVFGGNDPLPKPAEQVADAVDPTAPAIPPSSPTPPIDSPPDQPDDLGDAPAMPPVEPDPADVSAEPPAEEPIPDPSPPEAVITPKTTERRGDAEVAILSATVGPDASATALEEGRLEVGDPDAVALMVNLELRNAGDSQPLKYFSWAGLTAFDVPVALRDDRDRSYRQKTPVDESYPNQPEADANVYVITEENFRQKVLQAEKPVLVQVYAPWSEGCKSLMPAVDHLSAVYAETAIVGRYQVADADEPGKFQLTPLLQRYKIQSIPVVLVFNKGKPVNGWAGVVPLGTMEEALDALLPPKPPAYETLPPGGVVHQRLVFEPPDKEAKALHLTLPGSAVGVEGTFELVVPREMIVQDGQ